MAFSSSEEERAFEKLRFAFRLIFSAIIGAVIGYCGNYLSNTDLNCSEATSGLCSGLIWGILIPLAMIFSLFGQSSTTVNEASSGLRFSDPWNYLLQDHVSHSSAETIGIMSNCAIICVLLTWFIGWRKEKRHQLNKAQSFR